MKEINLHESSVISSQNTHKTIMIYLDQEAVGNAFVDKSNKTIPKKIQAPQVPNYNKDIEFICWY